MTPTQTISQAHTTLRIAHLLAEAGLVSQEAWEAYQSQRRKHKSLVEVLNQEAFSFKDLLFKAEINPFRLRQASQESRLTQQLLDTVDIQPEELIDLLHRHQTSIERLTESLDTTGVVERWVMDANVEQAQKLKEDPVTWLVRRNVITPQSVSRFLHSPANAISQACAFFISIRLLEHNGLISEASGRKLAQALDNPAIETEDGLRAAQTQARKALSFSDAELLNKLDANFFLEEVRLAETQINPAIIKLFPEDFIRRNLFLPLRKEGNVLVIANDDPIDLGLPVLIRWLTGRWVRLVFAPSKALQDRIQEFYASGLAASNDGVAVLAPPQGKAISGAPRPDSSHQDLRPSDPATRPPATMAEAVRAQSAARLEAARAESARQEPPRPEPGRSDAAIVRVERTERSSLSREAQAIMERRNPADVPVDSLSAVQIVSSLIESAIELKATDIHLEPQRELMVARFRIDGQLNRILNVPNNLMGPVIARIKVLASMDVTERRRPQDGHITLDMGSRHFDFRVATLPTVYGEKVAIRILDSSRVMTGISELGMNEKQLKCMERLIKHTFGIILVTGPTGSGKTSTLYSCLTELNREDRHLVTIEDPIEYQLAGINQVQVDPNTSLSFSEGLRAILRQDPNIIMVGEIRDPDTAKTAIRAALTGHLVFSTLHTNTAIDAFQALVNLGVSPYMIGSGVIGIIAQRLVRKLCESCKKAKPVNKALAAQLGVPQTPNLKWQRPMGCPECLGTGYSGRTGVFEIIEMTDGLKRAVLDDISPARLIEIANADGRISMQNSGLEKVRAGITSPEEVIEKVMLDI